MTNEWGEVWYYKYDALGRRIEKACPQRNTKTTYLWDGDQVAYQETEKHGKTESQRHNVFNDWELIAQQDSYFKTDLRNHHKTWTQATNYAVCQPNGQPLALFNPHGKRTWRKAPSSLWGLPLLESWESKQAEPLNPNLLFAGQYFDQESGLAYNRFRYYDPQSGCYLKSDPIGLAGGETPYSYVHNPMGWVDPFGLTSYTPPSKKSSYFAKSRKEALRKAKRDANIPRTQHPSKVTREDLLDYDQFGKKVPVVRDGKVVQTRNYHYTNGNGDRIVIQEHGMGHSTAMPGSGREPHFNVRPITNTNTGSYPGTYGHYNYKK